MTTAELLAALARECPNGVSFDPMAVRLLRRKVPLQDRQIRALQAQMFRLENGLWFSSEMISNHRARLALREQATAWLTEHGHFSVERLFNSFRGVLTHLAKPEDLAAFLRHLGFLVAEGEKGNLFCLQPPNGLGECLAATAKSISKRLGEAGGILPCGEISAAMTHLTAEALESVRLQFLPEVHVAEIRGTPCWCTTEMISLPEDFSERLTTAVDTLVMLGEKVSAKEIEFALNLFYRTRFREEYLLRDRDTFMRICAQYYHGRNDVFLNRKKSHVGANDRPVPGRRLRSPNTRFRNLGISVGATLVYTKDPQISCIVLDEFNRVQYEGRAWTISALAIHLLGVSSANGFCHFAYEGEVLWDRRSRLERADRQDESQEAEMSLPTTARETEGEVIGLEGRTLSLKTWWAFRSAGTRSLSE